MPAADPALNAAESRPSFGLRWPLMLLPLAYVAAALWARDAGGPMWLWFNQDPAYFYLLDALNVLEGAAPGIIYHPGTPLAVVGALVLKAAYPLADAAAVADAVLADPEGHLRLMGSVLVALNGLAVWVLGWAGQRVFGGLAAAGFLQMAPVISMVIVKNSYPVKPEALLVSTTLLLMALSVWSLRPGLLDRHRLAFAAAFGVLAGLGTATKLTALPVFVLPLFVLWEREQGVKAVVLYGAASLAAVALFTLPSAGAWGDMIAYFAKLGLTTGAYGGGEAGFADWGAYPKNFLQLFKRPALHVVLVLSLVVLALTWRRRARGAWGAEARLLAGVAAAQLAQGLLVAKQPSAHYMIPSYVLIPLGFVLAWRLGRALVAAGGPWPRRFDRGAVVVLAALIAAQALAVGNLARELSVTRNLALSIGDDRFPQCARIYSYAASNQSFALFLGDFLTGSRFSIRLAARRPANDYWLEHWWDQSRLVFRGWRGPEDMAAVIGRYPCTVFRSGNWPLIRQLLGKTVSGLTFDATCSTRHETIKTMGVDCDGRALR